MKEIEQEDFGDFEQPSRSARKRAVEALQKLGERLLELTPAQRARMPLPDDLRRAIDDALKMKSHGARRRQRQFIGRLMRELDAEPIRVALESLDARHGAGLREQRRIEQWRDRLLTEGEAALAALQGEFPAADRGRIEKLLRQAGAGSSPRARRELFRYLRDLAAGDTRGEG